MLRIKRTSFNYLMLIAEISTDSFWGKKPRRGV